MTERQQKVLIFGAAGFVGDYLAREFANNGYLVFGSDLQKDCSVEAIEAYYAADITDEQEVLRTCIQVDPDIIIDLAAISSVGLSWKQPKATFDVNVGGAVNVLEAARKQAMPPKVLLVGSSEEYAPLDRPLKESDPVDATSPYGISKIAQERLADLYGSRYGLKIYQTRSFNHTGVGQTTNFVLPNWISQVAEIERSGSPGVLKVGNLNVSRDFSDVRDVVRAYRMLVESDHYGEVFNIGSGKALSLRELLEMIVSLSSQEITVEVDPGLLRPSDTPYICCDGSKIADKLGFIPEIPLSETFESIFRELA